MARTIAGGIAKEQATTGQSLIKIRDEILEIFKKRDLLGKLMFLQADIKNYTDVKKESERERMQDFRDKQDNKARKSLENPKKARSVLKMRERRESLITDVQLMDQRRNEREAFHQRRRTPPPPTIPPSL